MTSRRLSSELKRRCEENITRWVGIYGATNIFFLSLSDDASQYEASRSEKDLSRSLESQNPALIDHSIAAVVIIETRAPRDGSARTL